MAAESYTVSVVGRKRTPYEACLVGSSLRLPAPGSAHARHSGGSGYALFAAHRVAVQKTEGQAEGKSSSDERRILP